MEAGNVPALMPGASVSPDRKTNLPGILSKLSGSSHTADRSIEPSAVPRRILVVDDDQDGASSLVLLLSMLGHETRSAHDGIEAVAVAEEFEPQIVLLDLNLPRLDGYDVCRRIRSAKWGQTMMIVAVTGWTDEEHRMQALTAGFDMHLVKPVSAETFMTVLAAGS